MRNMSINSKSRCSLPIPIPGAEYDKNRSTRVSDPEYEVAYEGISARVRGYVTRVGCLYKYQRKNIMINAINY